MSAQADRLYRPFYPHTNPQTITPDAPVRALVEIWPVGHVFRPGHAIELRVSGPPAVDSYYAYVPKRAPSVNAVLRGGSTASRLTLPVVGLTGLRPVLGCGQQVAVRCVPAS